jgi:amino-acid N-acetyltransferase
MKKENFTAHATTSVRKARITDVPVMQKLINQFANQGEMISRSLSELYDNVRDFHIYKEGDEILGVCALHVVWEDLAEIKSLAVTPAAQLRGIGTRLTRVCMDEAAHFGIRRIFSLTYHPEFFESLGFQVVEKEILPQKVWGECIKCAKFPDCNEVAMIYRIDDVPGETAVRPHGSENTG